MLEVNAVSLVYDRPVLQDVSLKIKAGEIVGLVGHSGAGKTSLLNVIGGVKDASSGTVYFEGEKVIGPKDKLVPGHDEIQIVNQDFGLDSYHSAEKNIREKILYLPEPTQSIFVNELLDLVELNDVKEQKANTLSGGEQQRLSIARALACEPKLLLLDEPFVHLDTRLQQKLTTYLFDLMEVRDMAVILVSHDGSEVLSMSNRILYIKEGKIRRNTTSKKAYYNYQTKEEGELYGWVNSAKVEKRRIFFRPDEYEIVTKNPDVQLTFDNANFVGGWYRNYFKTSEGKKMVLVHADKLENVKGITVKRKIKKA